MDIKVDISPDLIEKSVTDAIVQSSIGNRIKISLDKALQDYSFERAIDEEVRTSIRAIVGELLTNDIEITTKVRNAVSARLTDEFITKAIDSGIEKMGRSY